MLLINLPLYSCSKQSSVSITQTVSANKQFTFQKYFEKAEELLVENNLGGTIEMEYERSGQDFESYYLTIKSEGFSELTRNEIHKFLWTLYHLEVEDSGYYIKPKVISGNDEYLFEDGQLQKNGSTWNAPTSSEQVSRSQKLYQS